jgi:hypothetical protein
MALPQVAVCDDSPELAYFSKSRIGFLIVDLLFQLSHGGLLSDTTRMMRRLHQLSHIYQY